MSPLAVGSPSAATAPAGPGTSPGTPSFDAADHLSADEVLGRLQAAIEAVALLVADGPAASGWSGQLRTTVLAGWDRLAGQVAAGRAAVLGAQLRSGAWSARGDRSPEAWRSRTGREGLVAGSNQVRVARTLANLPAVADALAGGSITPTHVDALARVAETAGPLVAEQLATSEGQAQVLQLARRTDGRTFGTALVRWSAELDPAAVQARHDDQRAARYLNLTETAHGTALRALLDSQTGRRLRLALESVTPAPAAGDERSDEQRRADGLGVLAERVLSSADREAAGGLGRTQVSVLLSEQTWLAVRATDGTTPSVTSALIAAPPAIDEDGGPIPASELARLLCDCDLTRVVLGADSTVVDLGRTVRLHPARLRKAITARDGGCIWAGCTLPARYCQVHHPDWWSRGGVTSVPNGVLLCSFHHHEVHRRDLVITRHPSRPDRPGPAGAPMALYSITDRSGRLLADSRGNDRRDNNRDDGTDRPPLAAAPPEADLSGAAGVPVQAGPPRRAAPDHAGCG